jgi:hypothetical protein
MSSSSSRKGAVSLMAPGKATAQSLRFPAKNERIVPVDERLAKPETRTEIIDGVVHFTPPADEPHASLHFDLAALIWAHLAEGYECASIEDLCFVRPLPVRSQLDAADLDQVLVAALVARESPALMKLRAQAFEEGYEKGFAKGLRKGLRRTLFQLLHALNLHVDEAAKSRIEACEDEAQLERWANRALKVRTIDELFEEWPGP